jgi:regulator of sirC expression with transglutaminase-like and TPR domain
MKNSNSRIRVIWLIKVLVCALLASCNTAITLAENNIVDNLQVIQTWTRRKHSDNKLFQDLIQIDEQLLDIAETSLLIAKEEYSEIKIRDYVECIDWYARMIKARIMENDEPETIVNTINEFLFDELGFTYVQTGNLEDLYLNKVIDGRKETA